MLTVYTILLQISGEAISGFNKASETSVVNALLVSICVILVGVIAYLFKKYEEKIKDNKEMQIKALEREEHRNKEFLESEKETLKILNGVTNVLEMIEKVNDQDTTNIINKISEEAEKIRTQIDVLERTITDKIKQSRK
jgi:hypothetical protein